jgi:hypothetical protein
LPAFDGCATIDPMEPVLVRADVDAALAGLFDLNARLATIGDDIRAIRTLLGDDEDEEEAEGNS